jgi:hypothetical protein
MKTLPPHSRKSTASIQIKNPSKKTISIKSPKDETLRVTDAKTGQPIPQKNTSKSVLRRVVGSYQWSQPLPQKITTKSNPVSK